MFHYLAPLTLVFQAFNVDFIGERRKTTRRARIIMLDTFYNCIYAWDKKKKVWIPLNLEDRRRYQKPLVVSASRKYSGWDSGDPPYSSQWMMTHPMTTSPMTTPMRTLMSPPLTLFRRRCGTLSSSSALRKLLIALSSCSSSSPPASKLISLRTRGHLSISRRLCLPDSCQFSPDQGSSGGGGIDMGLQ